MHRFTLAAMAALPGALLVPHQGVWAQEPPPPPAPVEAPVDEEAPSAPSTPAPTSKAPPAPGGDLTESITEKIEGEIRGKVNDRGGIDFSASRYVQFDEPRDDVFGMGDTVEISAHVSDNAFAMARQVLVQAPIGGDLMAMGETLLIDSAVGGDVYAMGADVLVSENGSVGGDMHGVARTLELLGPVGGDLMAGAGEVILGSTVGGDAVLEVGEISFRDGGRIGGDLVYESPRRTEAAEGRVGGDIEYVRVRSDGSDGIVVNIDADDFESGEWMDDHEPEPTTAFQRYVAQPIGALMEWTSWRLWAYFIYLLVGFAMFALGGTSTSSLAHRVRDTPAESLGIGFVTFLGLPLASLLCIVFIIPFPLGILGLMTWGLMLFVGQIVVAQLIGDLILRQFRPDAVGSPYISLAVGLAPTVFVWGLPWIWVIASFVMSLLGMGAITVALRPSSDGDATTVAQTV